MRAESVQTVCVISSALEEDPADVLRFRWNTHAYSMQERACLLIASRTDEKAMELLPEFRIVIRYILRCRQKVVCKV